MQTCDCSATMNNTGTPLCQPLQKVAKKLIIVPTKDSTGAANKLETTSDFTAAELTAILNDTDKTQRWYPTPLIQNVGGERADPIYETAASGKKSLVMEGVRTFTCEIWDQGPEYKYQLDAARCTEFSIYIVDKNGNLIGMRKDPEDGYLYPIKIDKESFVVKWVQPTDTTTGKLQVSFDWLDTEDDALLAMISADDMSADLVNDATGLLDISAEYSSISQTGVTITLYERFGSRGSRNKLIGLVVGDFVSTVGGATSKLRNVTDGADVSISSFAENSPGVYTLGFTSQTVADVIAVKVVKNGFDFADVVAETFAIS